MTYLMKLIHLPLLVALSSACWAEMKYLEEEFPASYSFAREKVKVSNCGLNDGYNCDREGKYVIPGGVIRSLQIALADFNSLDLDKEQKDLRNYHIKFEFNESDQLIVTFSALLLPKNSRDGQGKGLLKVSIGKSVKYWIDQNTFEIIDRKYPL